MTNEEGQTFEETPEKTHFNLVLKKISEIYENNFPQNEKSTSDERKIAVVLSSYNAKELLKPTLEELISQMRSAGMHGEIFVVLNNGGGDNKDFIDQLIKEETKIEGVDKIFFAKSREEDFLSSKDPRKIIFEEPDSQKEIINSDQNNKVRLIFIEQEKKEANEGKIRGLRDVYNFLLELKRDGYYPRYLLAIDSETRLRLSTDKTSPNGDGLGKMIELSKDGNTLVGAANLLIPYDENGYPDFNKTIPPIQEEINIIHGRDGFNWLPGGATLGGFDKMVSILSVISQEYPGLRVEDVLTTIIANILKWDFFVTREVVHTNRCSGDLLKSFEQIMRWFEGVSSLEKIADDGLNKILNSRLSKLFIYPIKDLLKGDKNIFNLLYLLFGLPPYLIINFLSKFKPDDIKEGKANF